MATNLSENGLNALKEEEEEEEDEDDEEEQEWGDWNAEDDGGDGEDELESDLLCCLFCNSKFSSSGELFKHCRSTHYFDFHRTSKTLGLDFYGSFKLINYIRSQVAENRCWSCGLTCQSKQDLHTHLHETFSFNDDMLPWEDDRYLQPFTQEDPLLYNFIEDCEDDEDSSLVYKIRDLITFEDIHIDDDKALEAHLHDLSTSCDNKMKEIASTSVSYSNLTNHSEEMEVNGVDVKDNDCSSDRKLKDENLRVSFAKVAANEMHSVNKGYFGSYSSFGIHREMISDKVRTEAYRDAILNNPCLLRGAAVLDVGCGTGILSLFAAQAGASSVIAVDGSDKMAAVATQVAKDNGLWWSGSQNEGSSESTGVIRVIQAMVEELGSSKLIQPHSIDVLVSEWMGYCLLYESMLSSVLFARDQLLKPGGAILPDTATMFVAGFGIGGTSIPFWENVYGFNMSCISKDLIEEAARLPIVDVVDSRDIVTSTAVLQSFDLATMTPNEMDFTSMFELKPELVNSTTTPGNSICKTTCYGVVLWFETGFTSRFCKEKPIVLSTSPYTPKTHWAQTILTFMEPITMASEKPDSDTSAAVGSDACPAVKIISRISIARAPQHRSIDISLEITGMGLDGRQRSWPVQMFNLS